MEKKKISWNNPKLDLVSSFSKGDYSDLIEYSYSNILELIHSYFCSETSDVRKNLRFGSAVLSYFEATLEDDKQLLAAFKLGTLYGHVECLNSIFYEKDADDLVLYRFQNVKKQIPKYSEALLKEVLFIINSNSCITKKNLIDVFFVQAENFDFNDILKAFEEHGLIYTRDSCKDTTIFLSDSGIRLVKLLKG